MVCGVAARHTHMLCPPAVTTLTGKAVLITFKKAKVERTVTFSHMPSWLELCQSVEDVFTELQAEAFDLLADQAKLSNDLWPGSAEMTVTAKQTTMTLQVRSGVAPAYMSSCVRQATVCRWGRQP